MSNYEDIKEYQKEITNLKKENENLKLQIGYVLSKQSYLVDLINKYENLKNEKDIIYTYLSKANKEIQNLQLSIKKLKKS